MHRAEQAPPRARPLRRVPPARNPRRSKATVEVGADPIGIASGEGSLWVVNAEIDAKRGSVSRIDPATDRGSWRRSTSVRSRSRSRSGRVASGSRTPATTPSPASTPRRTKAVAGIDVCAAPEGRRRRRFGVGRVRGRRRRRPHRPRDRRDGRPGRRRAPAEVRDVRVRRHLGLELLRRDDHADRPGQRQGPRRDHDRAGTADHGRGRGPLWVSCTDADTVNAIDPATDEVVATVDDSRDAGRPGVRRHDPLGRRPRSAPELTGIDPSTQEVVARATVADHGLINANQVMVFEDGSLWLPILDDGAVLSGRAAALRDRAERDPAPLAVGDLHRDGFVRRPSSPAP